MFGLYNPAIRGTYKYADEFSSLKSYSTLHRTKKEKRCVELARSHRAIKLRKEKVYVDCMEQRCRRSVSESTV